MPKPVGDQVAVVLGASSGIGRATALAFARAGASVVCASRGAEALDTLVQEITAAGGQGVFGIAVSGALRELSGELAELPAERIDGGTVRSADDELSQRRRRRAAV